MVFEVKLGSNKDLLKELPDNSVDSIVTDPPYELGLMGKQWDSSGIAYDTEMWTEVLRVLKPGGHLLAFSGSRTYHRMTCAIEDAGFEIRDQIMWVYGSGFPKSLDVSKAIDKQAGRIGSSIIELKQHLIALVDASGKTRSQVDIECGFRATNYLTLPAEGKRHDPWVGILPTPEKWVRMREVLGAGAELDEVFSRAEREVIGTKKAIPGVAFSSEGPTELDVTAPATDAARQWEGWGTALKPAHEPICVARKPLVGTVAANVLEHGTGALNIDGCRVHSDDSRGYTYTVQRMAPGADQNKTGKTHQKGVVFKGETKDGRCPANLIHDGSDEVVALFPGEGEVSAARFFYCAKASKSDRGEGNTHPTVKPNALMRYLVRLVTPPGGKVLDIFNGSGSTGIAAVQEGFDYLGFDITPEYVEISNKRIQNAIDEVQEKVKEESKPQASLLEFLE